MGEYEHPDFTDWSAHYVDWVENVDHRQPTAQEIVEGAEGLRTGKFNIHFHVWTAGLPVSSGRDAITARK
jgi:hypothetical protein